MIFFQKHYLYLIQYNFNYGMTQPFPGFFFINLFLFFFLFKWKLLPLRPDSSNELKHQREEINLFEHEKNAYKQRPVSRKIYMKKISKWTKLALIYHQSNRLSETKFLQVNAYANNENIFNWSTTVVFKRKREFLSSRF